MNFTIKLCQPCYFYRRNNEVKPNLRRGMITLEELTVMSDGIEVIKSPLTGFEPFTQLIKIVEDEKTEGFTHKGYYICGELDLNSLKKAVERRLVGKRLQHPSFSDSPLSPALESVAISWNDTHYLVEYSRGTKLIKREKD